MLPKKPGGPGSFSLSPDSSDGVVYVDEQVNALVAQFGLFFAGMLWRHERAHPVR